ncbi:MAG: YceD family protein [Lachnospiraceae bacterium]
MLLDLSELLSGNCREKIFDVTIDMEKYESSLGDFDIVQKSAFELKVVSTGAKKYVVSGESSVILAIPCGRCLKNVETKVDIEIERELDFNETKEESDESVEEMSYIDGYHLDVDKLVYSEILLNLPYRVLCSEDCKGLCFKCGADLNKGECGCDRIQLDPRMSVIQDIFKNFKEV